MTRRWETIPDDGRDDDKKRVTEGDLLGVARTRLYSPRHTPGL